MRSRDDLAQHFECALNAFGVDVRMRHKAHRVRRGIECPDAVGFERIAKLNCVKTAALAVEDDNVGLYFLGIDSQTRNFRDPLG